jgi:uncharacterized membrane protein
MGYDSVVVETRNDDSFEPDFSTAERKEKVTITGRARLTQKDIAAFSERLKNKVSYGESQAITPVYDVYILYFRKGKIKEEIKISLYTNNLFATFALPQQRQGDCMCNGNGGYCCSKGGISRDFKKFLVDILKKYHLPVDSDDAIFPAEDVSIEKPDTLLTIKAWGSEPFWTLEIHDSVAIFQIIDELNVTYKLVQRIPNMGFTNESIDTYLFRSETDDEMKLTLLHQSECACGFDMSDGESKTIAIIFFNTKNTYLQYLGCARIFLR